MNDCSTTTLKDQLDQTRQQVLDVLFEIDDINLQVNPQIQARYAKSVGYLENDLFKWQLRARRAKRKFALIQAAANRGEEVHIEAIELTLDEEFAEWEARIAAQAAEQLEMLEALANTRPMSPREARELKELHRKLIKRLHPDLLPGQSEDAQRFFLVAQTAFEAGDLRTLRIVDVATEDFETGSDDLDKTDASEGELEIELAMVEAQLNIATEQLEALKHSHPYILLELLDNPIKLVERQHELEAQIEEQKKTVQAYEERIQALQGDES